VIGRTVDASRDIARRAFEHGVEGEDAGDDAEAQVDDQHDPGRYRPPPEFLLALPYTQIDHHLSGPNMIAFTW